ncbi:hypothetical protein DIPPA_11280 [Diplonema papillatum]|nr:hypothetical protein DIPPA_11280 [Diplonema papillatum]
MSSAFRPNGRSVGKRGSRAESRKGAGGMRLPPVLPALSAGELMEKWKKPRVPRTSGRRLENIRSVPQREREAASPGPRGGSPGAKASNGKEGKPQVARAASAKDRDELCEKEFTALVERFEELDPEANGELTWAQLQQLAAKSKMKVDYTTFKRIDKDRSGKIDFDEMLRLFYPRVKPSTIRHARACWGYPGKSVEAKQAFVNEADGNKALQLDTGAVRELLAVFKYFSSVAVPESVATSSALRPLSPETPCPGRLSHNQMRWIFRKNPHVTDADLEALFAEYSTAPDAEHLSFEDFVNLMENVVVASSQVATAHVTYCFTGKPPPATPEL